MINKLFEVEHFAQMNVCGPVNRKPIKFILRKLTKLKWMYEISFWRKMHGIMSKHIK